MFETFVSQNLGSMLGGAAGGALVPIVFMLIRLTLAKLRPIVQKTPTQADDVALDVVGQATDIAEKAVDQALHRK